MYSLVVNNDRKFNGINLPIGLYLHLFARFLKQEVTQRTGKANQIYRHNRFSLLKIILLHKKDCIPAQLLNSYKQ
jgi:hypothetical protein